MREHVDTDKGRFFLRIQTEGEHQTAILAKALYLVFEDRVLVPGNKTIVFE